MTPVTVNSSLSWSKFPSANRHGPFEYSAPWATARDTQTTSNTSRGIGSAASTTRAGQSFTPSISYSLAYLDLSTTKIGSPTDQVIVDIYSNSSNLPGSLLTSSDAINAATISNGTTRFTFSSPPSLTSSTKYWWVARRTGAVDGSNYISLSYQSGGNVYSGGGAALYNGTSWGAESTLDDNVFTTYSSATVPVLYGVFLDTTANNVEVWKSGDSGATWVESDSANHKSISTTAANKVVDAVQVGSTLHITYVNTSNVWIITQFNLSTGLWGSSTSGTGPAAASNVGGTAVGLLCVRSNGDYVLFHHSATETVMSTAYRRVSYSRYVSGTWTLNTTVGGTGAQSHYEISSAAIDASDRCYFTYATSLNGFSYNTLISKTLTSANILNASTTIVNTPIGYFGQAVVIDDTTDIIATTYNISNAHKIASANVADGPTWSSATVSSESGTVGGQNNGSIVADGTTIYTFWRPSGTSELWYDTGTIAGGYGVDQQFTSGATVVMHSIGKITNAVGVFYSDNGTVKYDALILSVPSLTRTATPITIALNSPDKTRSATPITMAISALGKTRTATPVTISLAAVGTRTATPITVALSATSTRTATPITAALMQTRTRTATPVTISVQTTSVRTATPVTMAIAQTNTRTATPITIALLATSVRTMTGVTISVGVFDKTRTAVPNTIALSTPNKTRTATPVTISVGISGTRTATPITIALMATLTRTASATMALQQTRTRSATPITIALATTLVRTMTPVTMSLSGVLTRTATPITMALLATFIRTAPATMALSSTTTRTATPITVAISESRTRTATPITMALSGAGNVRTSGPTTFALQATFTRTATGITTALKATSVRTMPATMALAALRTITPVTMALYATSTRTAPATMALSQTRTRTAPATMALSASLTRTAPATIALSQAKSRTATPVTMAVYATLVRTASASFALSQTRTRTASPVTIAVLAALTRTAPTTVSLSLSSVREIADVTFALRISEEDEMTLPVTPVTIILQPGTVAQTLVIDTGPASAMIPQDDGPAVAMQEQDGVLAEAIIQDTAPAMAVVEQPTTPAVAMVVEN